MKKMILTLVAVIAISSTALAQDQQGPRPERKFSKTEMAKHRTDEMAKEYKLKPSNFRLSTRSMPTRWVVLVMDITITDILV